MVKIAQGTLFYSFMLGMTIIILALALAFPVKEQIDSVRNETTNEGVNGLNCTNTELSIYDKGACIVTDMGIFYFIGSLIFVGGAVLMARVIFA